MGLYSPCRPAASFLQRELGSVSRPQVGSPVDRIEYRRTCRQVASSPAYRTMGSKFFCGPMTDAKANRGPCLWGRWKVNSISTVKSCPLTQVRASCGATLPNFNGPSHCMSRYGSQEPGLAFSHSTSDLQSAVREARLLGTTATTSAAFPASCSLRSITANRRFGPRPQGHYSLPALGHSATVVALLRLGP